MRTLALIAFCAVALFFILRPVFQKIPELHAFLLQVDAKQVSYWSGLRVLMKGVKTIVWGRFVAFAGPLLAGLQFFDFIDLTTILPPIEFSGLSIPATMYVPMLLTPVVGYITNVLRRASDGPAGVNTFVLEPEKIPDAVVLPTPQDPSRDERIAAARAVLEAEGVAIPSSPPAKPVDVDAPSDLPGKIAEQAAAATPTAIITDTKVIPPAPAPAFK